MGIDISPKTIARAEQNLAEYQNKELICGDFMSYEFCFRFDVVYSSLTFMHIEDKRKCINKISSLLNLNGVFVLSIDKNQSKYIEYEDRKIEIYPDNPTDIKSIISECGLTLSDCIEKEFAYILVCKKA